MPFNKRKKYSMLKIRNLNYKTLHDLEEVEKYLLVLAEKGTKQEKMKIARKMLKRNEDIKKIMNCNF
jgi:hypothetical protein